MQLSISKSNDISPNKARLSTFYQMHIEETSQKGMMALDWVLLVVEETNWSMLRHMLSSKQKHSRPFVVLFKLIF